MLEASSLHCVAGTVDVAVDASPSTCPDSGLVLKRDYPRDKALVYLVTSSVTERRQTLSLETVSSDDGSLITDSSEETVETLAPLP